MTFGQALRGRLAGLVEISDRVVSVLEAHYQLLVRWNRRLNLTSVVELEAAVERHYSESLLLAARVGSGTVYDIGSGAGFPGFVVGAYCGGCRVTLVESDQRKAAFLREASDLVSNVRVACVRGSELLERVDWVVGRAVRIEDVLEVGLRLTSRIGVLVGETEKERLVGEARLQEVEAKRLPWGEARWLVVGSIVR